MFELKLYGALQVRTPQRVLGFGDFGGVKQRHILQLLVLYRTLSKTDLAELLWEGNPPAEHVATLESYVSSLRRRLDPSSPARRSVVMTRTGGYALDDSRVSADVWRFDALLGTAATLPAAAALPHLEQALALAGAPLLAQETSLEWMQDAHDRHRVRYVAGATRAAEHALVLGDARRAQELAGLATDLDPLAEAAWRVRMAALDAAGDRAGALRCYQSCRRALSDELGIEPAAATHERFVKILQSDSDGVGHLDQLAHTILAAARELAVAGDSESSTSTVVQLLTRAQRLARGVRGPGAEVLQAIA
jgi:DNA-binding SARP family transcriptional activator